MKKLLVTMLVMVMVLGLMGGVVMANDCERYGQGYWKQWLAEMAEEDPEWECGSGFTAQELLDMLNTPARGDATQILLYQFIAASLNVNVEECVPPLAVIQALEEAGAHLEALKAGEDSGATRDEILYWKDILEFWNENKYAELESVVYEGVCNKYGSHAGDMMTFTFSNDVFLTDDIEIDRTGPAQDGYLRLAKHPYMEFNVDGNILTVEVTTVFSIPRDLDKRALVEVITGLYDFIGNPVVIPDGGVSIEVNSIYPKWLYELDITSINDNTNWTHYFNLTYNVADGSWDGYGTSPHAGNQTLSEFDYTVDEDGNISFVWFRSDYAGSYYWEPGFILEDDGSLTWDGGSTGGVWGAEGTWAVTYLCE